MAKAEANLTQGVLTARPPPCVRSQRQSGCLAGELGDPRVVALYGATSPQELRVPAAFFCGSGWQPDQQYYTGSFDPARQWKSKAKGELMVSFDGDERSTKVTLRSLLDHSFSVAALTQTFVNGAEDDDEEEADAAPRAEDSEELGDSSDEEALVAELRGRSAAAAARARLSERSPGGSDSSGSAWSPRRRKRSPPDSFSDSSPIGEQPSQQPTPGSGPPRRSPRSATAAPARAEPAEEELDSSDEETERLASERTKYGAKVVCTTKDKFQPVKSLEWTLADPSKLTDDAREEYPGSFGTKYAAVLLNYKQSLGKQLDVYELWKHMLPSQWLQRFVDTANKSSLSPEAHDPNYRLTNTAEVEVVLGLALAACVHGSGPFDSFFSTTTDESGLFPSPGFGRHGVNKNRALILLRVMHLSHGPEQPGEPDPRTLTLTLTLTSTLTSTLTLTPTLTLTR